MNKKPLSVETVIQSSISRVWTCWNKPEHIVNWAFASDDWEAPAAKNDLRIGGRFTTTMAAKDKSYSFDFSGTYTALKEYELIEYDMDDGRHAKVEFSQVPEGIKIKTTFDPEKENPEETQIQGWQAISNNFKKYTENTS